MHAFLCLRLEFEKTFLPLFLYKKKRYSGLMYTVYNRPDKIDSKGLQLVRRDSIPFVREVSKDLLQLLMYEKNVKGAYLRAREAAKQLVDSKVPMEKLILSKTLRKGTWLFFFVYASSYSFHSSIF